MHQSQPVFPTPISSSVLCLIDLLFDHSLNYNNHSSRLGQKHANQNRNNKIINNDHFSFFFSLKVSALAQRVVWACLTEDAALFLRYFFEKITHKEKKNYLIQYLKKLVNFYVDLPSQTAYVLFNYLVNLAEKKSYF